MSIFKSIIICLCMALTVAACKSPSDKIMDDFNKADSSLENTDAKIVDDDSLTLISLSILAMQKQNPQLATEADSIYLATTSAGSFIDSLKNVLSEKDATGENAEAAMQVMNTNNTGGQLYHYLLNAYTYTTKVAASKNKDRNKMSEDIYAIPSSEAFIQKYFKGTKTAGAVTILTKLKSDCIVTAIAALNDIKEQLKYKWVAGVV